MISSLDGLDALTHAQVALDSSARQIAQAPATPDDIAGLIQAKNQFSMGLKVVQTDDQMAKKLIDVFG